MGLFGKPDQKKTKKKERDVFDLGYYKQNVHNLSEWWGAAALLLILGLGIISERMLMCLPTALTNKDVSNNPNSFISERAWTDLRILNDFGSRPVGSYANEVLALDFLKREISYIQQLAHKNQKIYADVQQVTGSFWLDLKPQGVSTVYRNIQNVIVTLVGEKRTNDSDALMLNCHYDSVAGSPGASDDGANCCVMLEILRVLSKQSHVNRHSIIFLFNGAEETMLQAAHGFITQHSWAKNIKAFINLESAGSNGKESLFQTGPNHAWLVDMYHKAAVHPNGKVSSEEIFQSGFIPSDTDFRIFRDFGHIPGLDFAHNAYGYRYHTKYDHIDYLSMPFLQHTGNNILSLTKMIANSDELSNTEALAEGRKVYFDVLGLFFISYSESTGTLLNIIVSILSVFVPYYTLGKTTKGVHNARIQKEMLIGFFINIFSAALSAILCYGIGWELDLSGNSMTWYHHTIFATALYSVPTVLVHCFIHRIFKLNKKTPLSLGLNVQARLNGSNIMWSILTLYITASGYRSAFTFMVPLLIVTISNIVIGITGIQNSIKKWLYVHIFGQIFVILWATHHYAVILGFFIPITGRIGSMSNPEFAIGLICCFSTIFTISYLAPLVGLLNRTKLLLFSLFTIFLITRIGFISLTHIGFPYRDGVTGNPTPQRHFITHTQRTLYDQNENARYTDSGFFVRSMDRNAKKTIESWMAPNEPIPQGETNLCKKELFCAIPFQSIRQLTTMGYWVQGAAPILREEASLKLVSNEKINDFERKLKLTITGKVQLSFILRLKPNVHLNNWSILPTVPEPNEFNNEKAYFVTIIHGIDAPPYNVTVDLRHDNQNYDGPLIDVNIVTTHWEYHREHTPTFANLLARVPGWAFAVPAVCSVQAWTF